MSRDIYTLLTLISGALWMAGAFLSFRRTQKAFFWTVLVYGAGIFVYGALVAIMWVVQKRPPMVTMGEIRLWYALFLSLVGLLTFLRWRSSLILPLSTVMAVVFAAINLLRPHIHSHVLAPALRSIFFVPHVTVYMFSYALLACSFLLTPVLFFSSKKRGLLTIDTLSRMGFSLFTMGMLLGAVWARRAWGDYWTWDPKETWAAVTWLLYLLYFHIRQTKPQSKKTAALILVIAFLSLQLCWYGYRYLPGAETGLHNYVVR
ncbi:MAG: cytochrome c biogenesis protein CcsA [Bacteroidales bacterium]|jgi:ABC-type transport system involved in cytochrome c biogenesis permease subunit